MNNLANKVSSLQINISFETIDGLDKVRRVFAEATVPCGEGYVRITYRKHHSVYANGRAFNLIGVPMSDLTSTTHISDAMIQAEDAANEMETLAEGIYSAMNGGNLHVGDPERHDELFLDLVTNMNGLGWDVGMEDGIGTLELFAKK